MGKELVVTIGNATGEHVVPLKLPEFKLGRKQTAKYLPILAGGSSVNHACRLLAAGLSVFPILPIVDDPIGRIVVDALKDAAKLGNCDDPRILPMKGDDLATPLTSVLTFGRERTVIAGIPETVIRRFPDHLEKCLTKLEDSIDAVMIGHMYADRASHPGQHGACSQRVIKEFYERGVFTFANFGFSQYKLGASFWGDRLKKLSCFQLDIDEVREFGMDANLLTLANLLKWFRDKCAVLLTMGDLGAIGQLKNREHVVFVGPYELGADEIRDSTGAGDAFGSGFVASCLRRPLIDEAALAQALEEAMLWRAYASTTFAGANGCPNREALIGFKLTHRLVQEAESMPLKKAARILGILDRATLGRKRW